jgi:hypothetical protein
MKTTGTTDIQHVLVDLGVEVTRAGEREISTPKSTRTC